MFQQILVIVILCVIFIEVVIHKLKKEKSANEREEYNELKKAYNTTQEEPKIYTKKRFLTPTESLYYSYFKKLEPEYIILPQVNLASIINKIDETCPFQNELYRNLDFCIFNQKLELLLAIEINDDSHKSYKRRERDKKVKEILRKSNIELLTYNVNFPNTEESVIQRTKEALENIKNKNN